MSGIERIGGHLHVDGLPLASITETHGTPLYVYSRDILEQNWKTFDRAFGAVPHRVCYAVKANSNLAVLSVLAKLGSSFDIVSGGELKRVLAAGAPADRVVFSGVGKTIAEMEQALQAGILCFNIESTDEATRLGEVAERLGVVAPVSFRINPDVDAQTHPYISTGLKENKFGIAMEEATAAYKAAAAHAHLSVCGIDCHIGSQLTSVEPFEAAFARMIALVDELKNLGIELQHIDFGGGQGIRYSDEEPLDINQLANAAIKAVGDRPLEIWMEPGRAIVGPAGVLVTQVEYLKQNSEKAFAVVDGAMNDLIRPALYSAWQPIVPVIESKQPARVYDVVGPVCESADFLGKDRELSISQGDYLAVLASGAYAFVMSSNYNTRARAAEVMVSEGQARLVRKREIVDELFALESTV